MSEAVAWVSTLADPPADSRTVKAATPRRGCAKARCPEDEVTLIKPVAFPRENESALQALQPAWWVEMEARLSGAFRCVLATLEVYFVQWVGAQGFVTHSTGKKVAAEAGEQKFK